MRITDFLFSIGRSGFFNEDLTAIKQGAQPNGLVYSDDPVTPGFETIVQPGNAVSIMLILEDGSVGIGDCTDVIFAGQAGRDRLFRAEEHSFVLNEFLPKELVGKSVASFRPLGEHIDRISFEGKPLHKALRYGVTQAILHATSLAKRSTISEVVAEEYGASIMDGPIRILANCEPFDHLAIDKAIVKGADMLPHGAFPQVERDLGADGKKLIEYTSRLVARIAEIGAEGYRPAIHYDLYGSAAELFDNDPDRMVAYFAKLETVAAPFDLYIESPAVMANRDEQIEIFGKLLQRVQDRGSSVKFIADEWCNTLDDIRAFADQGAADFVQVKTPDLGGVNNTIEALLYASRNGVGACLGGSGNETDLSTRITTQIGLACDPDFMLAKPGFGCDESLMILTNEMQRTLALVAHRRASSS